MASTRNYEFIKVERVGEKKNVGLITLNRPKVLNALSGALINELIGAMKNFDSDETIGATVLTGNEKAFAAGADIKEMAMKTYSELIKNDFIKTWDLISTLKKPIIAAVNGYVVSFYC